MIYDLAEDYVEWAEDYYEMELSLDAVTHIYRSLFMSETIILELNPERNVESAVKELEEIGILVQRQSQG